MATITSASTLAEIEAAYLDNLSYDTDNSLPKAYAFREAARALRLKRPQSASSGPGSVSNFDIDADLRAVAEFIAGAEGSTRQATFTRGRPL